LYHRLEQRLSALLAAGETQFLQGGLIGLEKETLRVGGDGKIAQTPHPAGLGSALTHPWITTDYSEALTELITPALSEPLATLDFLRETQAYVYRYLEDELLWATSMPCVVAGETGIPIARYGSSNPGLMKTAYRRGLGHRYGRVMQVIAGVHFNYSVAEQFWPVYQALERDDRPLQQFINEQYMALIRNLLRFGWLIPYLFGASPAICKSFLAGKETDLQAFNESTFYEPWATSLRMGDIGYQNNKEKSVGVRAGYDSLAQYIRSLRQAVSTPFPAYEKIGVEVNGVFQQLNANILQIENEYYSTVRPKQPVAKHEMPLLALQRRGIRYIELRSLDVNAFEPLGVNAEQLYFLEAFMLFCLLLDSPVLQAGEQKEIDHNELITAHEGRREGLQLRFSGKERTLQGWAGEILQAMTGVCEILDKLRQSDCYSQSVQSLTRLVENPDLTPSARMLAAMRESQEGFFDFALRLSRQHQSYFQSMQLPAEKLTMYDEMAETSRRRQQEMEAVDKQGLSAYLAEYFGQIAEIKD